MTTEPTCKCGLPNPHTGKCRPRPCLGECDQKDLEIKGDRRRLIEMAKAEERERIVGIIEGMKTDEQKVAIFGKRMDSWEARTYDEKQLVNAVLCDLLKEIKK